jgi:hypothetical protein
MFDSLTWREAQTLSVELGHAHNRLLTEAGVELTRHHERAAQMFWDIADEISESYWESLIQFYIGAAFS